MYTNFNRDLNKGKRYEEVFVEVMTHNNFKLNDVRNNKSYQINDIDYITDNHNQKYDVKPYYDDQFICIENWSNYNPIYGPKKPGWILTSKADFFAFTSVKTRKVILLKNDERLKIKYKAIAEKYKHKANKISFNGDSKWQSSFTRVPYAEFRGLYQLWEFPKGNPLQTEIL